MCFFIHLTPIGLDATPIGKSWITAVSWPQKETHEGPKTMENTTKIGTVDLNEDRVLKRHQRHAGAFSSFKNIDLNKDWWFQIHRTLLWRFVLFCDKRSQQRLHTSNAQNTILVHFLVNSWLTLTWIVHLYVTEHHSGAFSCHEKVDLNRDCAPQPLRTPFPCIFLLW